MLKKTMVAAGEERSVGEEIMEANRSRNRGLFNSGHEG
ncbi:F15O4.36 [Arabidopsis thaliana]|uniref:F15O4.36 n=1 Tax=Arabidopsis thaliana TaxID=3702 RepID=Q9LQE9_ARATH|nr:F15O4.36 [Arabidopsis thaliana]